MTRIDDVADLLGGPNCGCVPGETAACELADAGHLLPDLPEPDRHNYWWPKHGRNYGYVSGHVPLNRGGGLRHGEWEVVIGRGSGYIHLTPDEAEELASLLLAAAHHERNQE